MKNDDPKAEFEVWIETKDGKRLDEHQVQHFPAKGEAAPYSRCFAQCREDTEFVIWVKCLKSNDRRDKWQAKVQVDGRVIDSGLLKSPDDKWDFCQVYEAEGGRIVGKTMKFAVVPTVEDAEEAVHTLAGQRGIGTITVSLKRGWTTRLHPAFPRATLPTITSLYEQDTKAKLGLYTSTGTVSVARQTERCQFWSSDGGKVYYHFEINYRTKTQLILAKIIEDDEADTSALPASTESRSSKKRKRDDSEIIDMCKDDEDSPTTRDSKAALLRRIKALEETNARLAKRQRIVEDRDVVDLTGLDDDASDNEDVRELSAF